MASNHSHPIARRVLPKLAVSIVLGGVLAWLVARGGVPLVPPKEAFAQVTWWAVPAYTVSLAITHFLRAARWRFLIEPIKKIPLKEVVVMNWIGFFAIFALPLRLGEFARPILTKMRHGIQISAGLGTVAAERVIDGLVTSLCVAWALLALPRRETHDRIAEMLPAYGYAALALFSAAFVVLIVFLWQRDFAVRMTERVGGWISPKLAAFVSDKISGVADGLLSIGNPRLAAGFILETLAYWASNAAGMWLLAVGCGLPMDFEHAVAVMGILAIGILLPTGPGLFGAFQLAIAVALKLYFPEELVATAGSVYIFLMYAVQAVFITLTGVIPLYTTHTRVEALLEKPE